MTTTPTFGFGFTTENDTEAAKSTTQNENWLIAEALMKRQILDRDLTAPPGGESNGDMYIVQGGATGAWAGQDYNIALYYNGWIFIPPVIGPYFYLVDEDVEIEWATGSPNEWAIVANPSAIAVEDDGTEILATASRLNFSGAGVTVTDSGGGEAQVAISGGGGALVILGGVRLSKSSAQTITNNSTATLTWATEVFDPLGVFDSGTSTTNIVVPTNCTYCEVTVNVLWASNATGYREVDILFSGTSEAPMQSTSAFSGALKQTVHSGLVAVSASDVITARVLQNSGGNLDINTARTFISAIFYG